MILATDMAKHKQLLSTAVPDDEHELLAFRLMLSLKVADLSQLVRKFRVHCRWTGALKDEFYSQGDREKAKGLVASPGMDR